MATGMHQSKKPKAHEMTARFGCGRDSLMLSRGVTGFLFAGMESKDGASKLIGKVVPARQVLENGGFRPSGSCILEYSNSSIWIKWDGNGCQLSVSDGVKKELYSLEYPSSIKNLLSCIYGELFEGQLLLAQDTVSVLLTRRPDGYIGATCREYEDVAEYDAGVNALERYDAVEVRREEHNRGIQIQDPGTCRQIERFSFDTEEDDVYEPWLAAWVEPATLRAEV